MCLGRWKRRGRGAGWQVVWATAARGARSQLPGPQREADWLLADQGRPALAQAPRLVGGIHHPSLDQVPLACRIMSASRTAVPEYRLTYSYVLCKSKELNTTPQVCQSATLEVLRGQLSPKCSLRQQQSSGWPVPLRVLLSYIGTLLAEQDSPLETCLCAAKPPMPSSHPEEHHRYQSSQ